MDRGFHLMPEQASTVASQVDAVYTFLLLISAIFTLGIAVAILYLSIKYRKGSKADRRPGSGAHTWILEASWIIIPFILTMIIFFWGATIYLEMARPPAGATEINCVAKQWMWKFQHPSGNQEINDLHLPLDQPVKVNLISEDVIHSFYVPAFRVKQDVLPGRYTSVWFKPTKPGRYHLFCAEYCGAKHSAMIGTVHVLEQRQYQEWLQGGNEGQASKPASGKLLFEQLRCHTCHLGGGMLGRGPSLEGIFGKAVPLQGGGTVTVDENYLRESILRPAAKVVAGYQPIMPSFEGQISEEGLLQLIGEIKSLTRPVPQPEGRAPEKSPAEKDSDKGGDQP
jgi:cytochrome c oxidase subunit 2